jgi:PPP family 3-phenylpropionic acid transporter
MMFLWKRFGGKISARTVMMIAAGASVLRWSIMAFEPGVPLLIALQMTHGITFAIGYLGCVHFIANWTSEDIAAETQSLFVVGQQLLAVVAVIGFGWLVQDLGPQAYLVAAGMAFVGGVCVWISLRMRPAKAS